ncbi:UbiA prenyltransferase family [Schizophyllum amplum]|uniref:UbiA prenyltransferase family n=1 Tax=Schizophyllum amplum TaxID=97359 RepID=A0A550C0C9_9AGAR|nr:UbiA prenyltransferase family [Auriculariopsis ampla]
MLSHPPSSFPLACALRGPRALLSSAADLAHTIFLFNKSDIVSTVLPSMMAGMALVVPTDLASFVNGFLFLELHLIAFEIKNQTVGLEEDRAGKPDRPIVSGRISPDAAHILYLTFIAASLAFSAAHGVLAPSFIHLIAIYGYNECGLSTVWYLKSLICAVGYATYFWGIGVLFGGDIPLSTSAALAILVEAAIFTTTGHAQDFRDRDGDAAVGRTTVAMMFPGMGGRLALVAMILAWTAGLVYLWSPPAGYDLIFCGLATTTSVKFIRDHSQEADKNSYWWYNMWFITCHFSAIFRLVTFA